MVVVTSLSKYVVYVIFVLFPEVEFRTEFLGVGKGGTTATWDFCRFAHYFLLKRCLQVRPFILIYSLLFYFSDYAFLI